MNHTTFPLKNIPKQKIHLSDNDHNIKNKIILSVYIFIFYVLFTHPLFLKVFTLIFSNISQQNILNDNDTLNIFGHFIIGCIFSIVILLLI